MAGDQPPQRPRGSDDYTSGAGKGWTAVAYLITGILVWGFIGWLVDRWLDTGGLATAIGVVVGAALAVYLIVLRLGGTTR
jgi:F0F1-type ATP synthase assembly protein I